MTPRQREILFHSLGLNNARIAYRNFFAAVPENADWADLQGLVKAGLMRQCRDEPEGRLIYFHVTPEGEKALK